MSIASDAGVCRDCGTIGPREWLVAVKGAGGYDAYRCPGCATKQPAGAPT